MKKYITKCSPLYLAKDGVGTQVESPTSAISASSFADDESGKVFSDFNAYLNI